MVHPQYSPQEALERVKLMMKYDTSKTLNENVESIKQPINEIVFALPAVPWLLAGGASVLAGIGTWIYNTQGGGDSFTKTKAFFAGCSKNMKDLKPTVDKSTYRGAADSIYSAIEGFGTNKDAIKAALNSMPTVADLCALNSWYATQYGDLYDDLDSDIDGTDFTKYVWSAIAPKIADAEDDLSQAKTDGGKTGGGKTGGGKTGGGKTSSGYKACTGTYSMGCTSEAVKQVQSCLGLVADGKYGPKTNVKLKEIGFNSFQDADIDKICNKQTTTQTTAQPTQTDDIVQVDAEDSTDLLK